MSHTDILSCGGTGFLRRLRTTSRTERREWLFAFVLLLPALTMLAPFWTLQPTLEHFALLFRETLFPRWLVNTLLIGLGSMAISLFCGLLAAYALARLRFPGATAMGTGIFVTYLVPQTERSRP
jgi:ABC-type glycerol-3-phosphate transport system permease component